jgi:hypothetical protein
LVVKVGVRERHDHLFFDLAFVVDEVVMTKAGVSTVLNQNLACAVTDAESVHSRM